MNRYPSLVICLVVFAWAQSVAAQKKPAPPAAQTPPECANRASLPDSQLRYAFLVTVKKFQNADVGNRQKGRTHLNNLVSINEPGDADIAGMKRVLTQCYGFPAANIKVLDNERATRKAIEEGFRAHLIANAQRAYNRQQQATVLFYFTGHGSRIHNQPGDTQDELQDGAPPYRYDETIIPYDGRDKAEKIADISDDELGVWLAELNRYTPNVTFIFDSCNSGGLARGRRPKAVDDDTGENKFPPNSAPAGARTDVILLAATSEHDLAYMEKGSASVFTTKLVEILYKANANSTYLGLLTDIKNALGSTQAQPQAYCVWDSNRNCRLEEGLFGAKVFGTGGPRETSYLKITEPAEGARIKVDMGAFHGLKEKTLLALSMPDGNHLATAQVTEVYAFDADAEIGNYAEMEFDKSVGWEKKVRVRLLAPALGGPLVVVTPPDIPGKAPEIPREVLGYLQKPWQPPTAVATNKDFAPLVKFVTANAPSPAEQQPPLDTLYLRRGPFGRVFPRCAQVKDCHEYLSKRQTNCCPDAFVSDKGIKRGDNDPLTNEICPPSPQEEVYYFADAADHPRFGFYVPANYHRAKEVLDCKLYDFLNYQRIAGIGDFLMKTLADEDDKGQPFYRSVCFALETAPPTQPGEKKIFTEQWSNCGGASSSSPVLPQGLDYRLKVTNNYKQPLYVYAFIVSNSNGETEQLKTASANTLVRTDAGQDGLLDPGSEADFGGFQTAPPPGTDVLKILVKEKASGPETFPFLEPPTDGTPRSITPQTLLGQTFQLDNTLRAEARARTANNQIRWAALTMSFTVTEATPYCQP